MRETPISCLSCMSLLGSEPTAQACALTGNPTNDLLLCRMMPSPLSHTSQGTRSHFYKKEIKVISLWQNKMKRCVCVHIHVHACVCACVCTPWYSWHFVFRDGYYRCSGKEKIPLLLGLWGTLIHPDLHQDLLPVGQLMLCLSLENFCPCSICLGHSQQKY